MARCLIFDLDGTLANTGPDLTLATNIMRQSYGLAALPLETVLSMVGHGLKNLAERAIEGSGADPDEALQRLLNAYRENLTTNTVLYPGVADTLARLKQNGEKMAVLTNKNENFSKTILSRLGVASYFDVIAGAVPGQPLKPDSMAVQRIFSKIQADASESWMIGDSSTDMLTAENAHMKSCFCTYGFRGTTSVPCNAKIDSFPKLLNALTSV